MQECPWEGFFARWLCRVPPTRLRPDICSIYQFSRLFGWGHSCLWRPCWGVFAPTRLRSDAGRGVAQYKWQETLSVNHLRYLGQLTMEVQMIHTTLLCQSIQIIPHPLLRYVAPAVPWSTSNWVIKWSNANSLNKLLGIHPKRRFLRLQNSADNLNFTQKDCLRTRKLSR